MVYTTSRETKKGREEIYVNILIREREKMLGEEEDQHMNDVAVCHSHDSSTTHECRRRGQGSHGEGG